MNIFIWENVSDLTENYHRGGGVAVVAESLERARELLPSPKPYGVPAPLRCDAHDIEPSAVYAVVAEAERVFVFPDAGCC